jgi:hypothetical protein
MTETYGHDLVNICSYLHSDLTAFDWNLYTSLLSTNLHVLQNGNIIRFFSPESEDDSIMDIKVLSPTTYQILKWMYNEVEDPDIESVSAS